MASILDFYPYPTFREGHKECLLHIEANINAYDIFLLVAPTGVGKTAIRQTIAQWYKDCVMVVPTNQLIKQERDDFPETRAMYGKDSPYYKNSDEYDRDKVRCESAHVANVPVLCTSYTLLSHQLQRGMLLWDEGHKLLEVNADLSAKKIWRHKAGYPPTVYNRQQLELWLRKESYMNDKAKKQWLKNLETNDFLVRREMGLYHSDAKDCIKLVPLAPGIHGVFRKKLKKLIILSATINEIDVAELKIGRGNRICKIELKSIIPPERRPIVRQYVGAINFYNMSTMAPKIGARLRELADYHEGKKGLAHVTYGLAVELEKTLRHDKRFMFHTKLDAKDRLRDWMQTTDKIFIAAGFSEGLDLKGSEYEWQAICKIGWPSLADSAIKKRSEANPKWYIWQTLKDTLQRIGRICRGPEDYGVTYILDASFERLLTEAGTMELLPGYFPEVE